MHRPLAVAGFGIASRVESFALIALIALAGVIGPFVGQNWGLRNVGGYAITPTQLFVLLGLGGTDGSVASGRWFADCAAV